MSMCFGEGKDGALKTAKPITKKKKRKKTPECQESTRRCYLALWNRLLSHGEIQTRRRVQHNSFREEMRAPSCGLFATGFCWVWVFGEWVQLVNDKMCRIPGDSAFVGFAHPENLHLVIHLMARCAWLAGRVGVPRGCGWVLTKGKIHKPRARFELRPRCLFRRP